MAWAKDLKLAGDHDPAARRRILSASSSGYPEPAARSSRSGSVWATSAVKLLVGEEATKANLFAFAPQGRYLHIATHQLVDETERRGYSRLGAHPPAHRRRPEG